MNDKLRTALLTSITEARKIVVGLNGPVEGISVVKKAKKASKKTTLTMSASNSIEKE